MKARNVRLCKKVVAIAMATSFTVVGTAAKVSGDEVKFSPELVKGHYYDEDVKRNKEDLMRSIALGGKAKTLEKKRFFRKKILINLSMRR